MTTSTNDARQPAARGWRMVSAQAAIIASCFLSAYLAFVPVVLLKAWIFGPPHRDFVENPFLELVFIVPMLAMSMVPCIVVSAVLKRRSGMSRGAIVLAVLTPVLLIGVLVAVFPSTVRGMQGWMFRWGM